MKTVLLLILLLALNALATISCAAKAKEWGGSYAGACLFAVMTAVLSYLLMRLCSLKFH